MTTRDRRNRLVSPDEVDVKFNSEEIDLLAQIAGISKAETPAFGVGIRQSVKQFLHDAQRLQAGEIQSMVKELERAITSALEGNLEAPEKVVQILTELPEEALEVLKKNTGSSGRQIPSPEDILSSKRGRESLIFLGGLCVRGAKIVPGRLRPGGKRSRRILKIEHTGPPIRRGRPRNDSEFFLCVSIGELFFDATGKMPGRVRWNQGHFVVLIEHVLSLVGADPGDFSADELVRRYERCLKEK